MVLTIKSIKPAVVKVMMVANDHNGSNAIYIYSKSTLEHIFNEYSNETMLEHLKSDLSYHGSVNLFQLLQ